MATRSEKGSEFTRLADLDADPFEPECLKVHSHKKGGLLDLTKVRIVPYFTEEQKNGSVNDGHELLKQLEGVATLNANVLDYWYKHQDIIPKEIEAVGIVYFAGTIYHDSCGNLGVRYLYHVHGGRWLQSFTWLGNPWHCGPPAAVLASSA